MAYGKFFQKALSAGFDLIHVLDPRRGKKDRAMLRDRSLRILRRASHMAELSALDLEHRVRGQVAETHARLFPEHVSDDVLVRRAASKLGRLVSYPHQVGLTAEDGKLIVMGFLPFHEIESTLAELAKVPGVKGVENQLDRQMTSRKAA